MAIWFVRYGATKFGGAENYLRRLISALELQNKNIGVLSTDKYCENTILLPKKNKQSTASYLKYLADFICNNKINYNGILFALERLPCADIYRAGDGVHAAWLDIKAKHQSALKTFIESFNPLHKTYLTLEKQTFENAKIIIANSQRGKDEIAKYYNIDKNKIRVIYNGVPLVENLPDKQYFKNKLCDEFGIDKNLPTILYVGSGFFRKGVKQFLEIIELLNVKVNAIIVGKDKKQKYYEKYAKKLGISHSVFFVGSQSDTSKFYSASDIFLFPTMYEPFSNACLEAMSYGNILFTTKQNGVSEVLQDDRFIIEDSKKTANFMDEILSNSENIAKYSLVNFNIAQNFSIDKNVEQTLQVIGELS